MTKDQYQIILFDGHCNLCSSSVKFIIKHDHKQQFKFAALQSEIGQAILTQIELTNDDTDSIILIKENQHYLKSTAALRIAKELNRPWSYFAIFLIIPPRIRDAVYALVAKYRYRIWGQAKQCRQATDAEKQRFL